jgi:hypothetical protein
MDPTDTDPEHRLKRILHFLFGLFEVFLLAFLDTQNIILFFQ